MEPSRADADAAKRKSFGASWPPSTLSAETIEPRGSKVTAGDLVSITVFAGQSRGCAWG